MVYIERRERRSDKERGREREKECSPVMFDNGLYYITFVFNHLFSPLSLGSDLNMTSFDMQWGIRVALESSFRK